MFNSTAIGVYRYEPSLSDPFDTTNSYYDPRIAAFSGLTGIPIPFMTRVPPNGFEPGQPPINSGNTRPRSLYDNEGRWWRPRY